MEESGVVIEQAVSWHGHETHSRFRYVLCVSVCTAHSCVVGARRQLVTSHSMINIMDQLSPLDLSLSSPASASPPSLLTSKVNVKQFQEAASVETIVRRNSISDGESGSGSGSRSGSPTSSSSSVSESLSPSDMSMEDSGNQHSKHYSKTKRFLQKYQAEQSENSHEQKKSNPESLVSRKDLITYGMFHSF